MNIHYLSFVWDREKEELNIKKHAVSFIEAIEVFKDAHRKIFLDKRHSLTEERMFCIGLVKGKFLTVRFTYRLEKIRIIGAGYWRKGEDYYHEKKTSI